MTLLIFNHSLIKIIILCRFYAKRCLVPIMEQMAKHMLVLKDETSSEIIAFLEKADRLGKNMKTNVVTQV